MKTNVSEKIVISKLLVLVLIFVWFFSDNSFAQCDWKRVTRISNKILQTRHPTNYYSFNDRKALESIEFISMMDGWTVGGDNIVLKTTDGGNTWKTKKIKFIKQAGTSRVYEVFFLNSKRGWIVGGRGSKALILATKDGGKKWKQIGDFGDKVDSVLTTIVFINEKIGWALGQKDTTKEFKKGIADDHKMGAIWHTSDGGNSWQLQHLDEDALFSLEVLDDGVLLVSGVDYVIKSENAGKTWDKIFKTKSVSLISKIDFVDKNEGWAITGYENVFHTRDSGETWDDIYIVDKTHNLTSSGFATVHFRNRLEGWVAGANEVIFSTQDGGKTWSLEHFRKGGGVLRDFAQTKDKLFVVGGNGTILSRGIVNCQ